MRPKTFRPFRCYGQTEPAFAREVLAKATGQPLLGYARVGSTNHCPSGGQITR